MTKSLSDYTISAQEIARHTCLDCGVNVIEVGDYCMIHPKIWRDKFKLGWDDNLCVACIERRLGRKLRLGELGPASVEGFPMSETLIARYLSWGATQGKPRKAKR